MLGRKGVIIVFCISIGFCILVAVIVYVSLYSETRRYSSVYIWVIEDPWKPTKPWISIHVKNRSKIAKNSAHKGLFWTLHCPQILCCSPSSKGCRSNNLLYIISNSSFLCTLAEVEPWRSWNMKTSRYPFTMQGMLKGGAFSKCDVCISHLNFRK